MSAPQALRRAVARGMTWWVRLIVAVLILTAAGVLPGWAGLMLVVLAALFLVRPPRSARGPIEVDPPVRGRWLPVNSPGSKVPSHGLRAYGQDYAVDVLRPEDDLEVRRGWRGRRPADFPSFGEPVHAVAEGTVVRVWDRLPDQRARDTWPALVAMMTVEAFLRELAGARWVIGNHVVVEHAGGLWSTYAHLRRGSVRVRPGERIQAGQVLGAVGNTGNTTQPHLHLQLTDHPEPTAAAGVPMLWRGLEMEGEPSGPAASGEPKPSALPGFPPNGQVFRV